MDRFTLKGKVAIITGGSKGIGKSISIALAEQGAKVMVSSRSSESVQAVADEISQAGGTAISCACHVGDSNQLKTLVDKTMEAFGRIDILINNAAINPVFAPLTESTEELFDKIMAVNVKACMTLANLCHPIMKENGGGSVINIASVEAVKPSIGLGIYSMSKAALVLLTKSQAKEWGRDAIRSNAICPGLIQTKLSSALWNDEKMLDRFTRKVPLNRMGQPEEIAGLAVFLASEAASYTTGSIFTSDGGYVV